MTPSITVARSAPSTADAIGLAVGPSGAVPRTLGLNRTTLKTHGFNGKPGDLLVIPAKDAPTMVAIGVGDKPTAATLRNAAARFVRAVPYAANLATNLAGSSDADLAQAVVEGALLARYRYVDGPSNGATPINSLTLVSNATTKTSPGAQRGAITAGAAMRARDLANTPPNKLTARDFAAQASKIAEANGLDIEIFDADALAVMGCGGLLGVNAGSVEPPRMVKLSYTPSKPKAHVALVGKGVMYDSGGISLKPSNASHIAMKMDMSGAAIVLSVMSTLAELKCPNQVTAWMMCTDNMPSGSALKLGDVITIRNGSTVEIHNTDAEGRLILADGLSLATEAKPDVIVDIATLTGSAANALGPAYAAVLGNDQTVIDTLRDCGDIADEPLWQLPLSADRYRTLLNSDVADIKNIGTPQGGAISAAIFLSTFVGDTPWAHIDIAGPMSVDAPNGWLTKGATAFGARLLVDFATGFTK